MHAVAACRTSIQIGAILAFTLGAFAILSPPATVMPAAAAEAVSDLDSEGLAANAAWWGALVTGTVPAIDAVLAPEFQIMRADGTGFDKAAYLASNLPKVAGIPELSEMTVTRQDDLLVTRYYVSVQEMRDGKTVELHAPRLTVFRRVGDAWLVVAHANFATLEK